MAIYKAPNWCLINYIIFHNTYKEPYDLPKPISILYVVWNKCLLYKLNLINSSMLKDIDLFSSL